MELCCVAGNWKCFAIEKFFTRSFSLKLFFYRADNANRFRRNTDEIVLHCMQKYFLSDEVFLQSN